MSRTTALSRVPLATDRLWTVLRPPRTTSSSTATFPDEPSGRFGGDEGPAPGSGELLRPTRPAGA